MTELVTLKDNEAFTDSLVIAKGTSNKHKNVKELIQKYESDLIDFGTLSVLNRESIADIERRINIYVRTSYRKESC